MAVAHEKIGGRLSACDTAFERVALDRILALETELKAERAESVRCREVAAAASEFVDNRHSATHRDHDLDKLYTKVEAWRLENERQLSIRRTRRS